MMKNPHTQNLAIGVDLGGTRIKLGAVDDKGKLLHDCTIPTEAEHGPRRIVENIAKGIQSIFTQIDSSKVVGIGIGAPGTVDLDGGTVKYPPNFPGWTVFRLGDELKKLFQIPVQVDNDANAAAIGEAKFGAGVGHKDFVMVTLGTGVGGGIILDGKIYRGPFGGAGELGHITIDYNGPKCNCGNYGCVEAYVGQRYLSKRTVEKLQNHKQSKIVELVNGDISKVEPSIITQAAKQGDEFALNVLKETGMFLGIALASVLNLFDLRFIIVGGGVAGAGKPLFDSITQTVKSRVLKPISDEVKVVPAQLGDATGVLGAAALVL